MRKLMWFTLGFGAACFLGAYFLYGYWTFLIITALVLLGISSVYWGVQKDKRPFVFLLGSFVGILWLAFFHAAYLQNAQMADKQKISGDIHVYGYGEERNGRCKADGILWLQGMPYRTVVNLSRDQQLRPGDVVSGSFRLYYTGPGRENDRSFHKGQGVFVLAYCDESMQIQRDEKLSVFCYPALMRRDITERIDKIFPEDTAGFARALLLGDSKKLSYETERDLRISGIRHVIAVSGLHVSVLFGFMYQLCGKRRGMSAFMGIPVLLIFSAVAGFTPSILRACIMAILMILAMLFDREYDAPTALSFSALIMLVLNPMVITNLGFQLTMGCMAGILLFTNPVRNYLMAKNRLGRYSAKSRRGRILSWIAGTVSVTLSASVFTLPLCAFYFGTVSILGLITNVLTLWVITAAFCGIIFSLLFSAFWLPAGGFAAELVSVMIRWCLQVSHRIAGIPFASVYIDSVYILAWVIFGYLLFAAFLLSKKKKPSVLALCLIVTLVLSITCGWIEPRLDHFRVTVLDVGQGQSVLLQCGEKTFLVDCGSENAHKGADEALKILRTNGVHHISGAILTHYDSDHCNGLKGVLDQIPAQQVYLPDIYDDNGIREQIEEDHRGNITWVREITELSFPGGYITIVPSHEGTGDNERGLCVLFQPEGYDILITGDRGFSGEQELIEDIALPELELLVAGHHGSKYSTGLPFLKVTKPKVVAISSGQWNHYGHPAQETLERLKLFGCQIVRTDENGTFIFRG